MSATVKKLPDPEQKLLAVAIAAWVAHSRLADEAIRQRYIRGALRADMTYALIDKYNPLAIEPMIVRLLEDAKRAIARQRPDTVQAVGGGHRHHGTHEQIAPATLSRDHAKPQTERGSEPSRFKATPGNDTTAAPNKLTILADKQQARAKQTIATEVRMSRLDTFVVNGQKIGDLTPMEANAWASSRERDARFVRILTANLPADRPIREYRTGDEADEIYSRAEAERAA